jgi:hypothetical protein
LSALYGLLWHNQPAREPVPPRGRNPSDEADE